MASHQMKASMHAIDVVSILPPNRGEVLVLFDRKPPNPQGSEAHKVTMAAETDMAGGIGNSGVVPP